MYMDILCEDSSIDLLEIVNMEQDLCTYYDSLNDIITETDLLNSIYEDQQFIKEADETLSLSGPVKTDDRSKLKKISDKVIQTIKDLIQRFLKRLKQFKNFLVELSKKKVEEKKKDPNIDMAMHKISRANPDVKVPVVKIDVWDANDCVIDSKTATLLLDVIEECINVIKDNRGKEITPKYLKEKCNKLNKITLDYEIKDHEFNYIYDLNKILKNILYDINIGNAYDKKIDKFDIKKIIHYDEEECSVHDYYNEYYFKNENMKKEIGKTLMVRSKKNDELYKRIEKIEDMASGISNMDPNVKYLKSIGPFVSVLYRAASYEQIYIAHLNKALQVHDNNVNKILSIKIDKE